MSLAINKPNILLMYDSDEKRLQHYFCLIELIMVKVMYSDKLLYNIVIECFFGISL